MISKKPVSSFFMELASAPWFFFASAPLITIKNETVFKLPPYSSRDDTDYGERKGDKHMKDLTSEDIRLAGERGTAHDRVPGDDEDDTQRNHGDGFHELPGGVDGWNRENCIYG